ncbi:FeoC-like transcriptional regulator [Echinimonas agarilytica]|uniref:FeoC-like transcriptional regulator n=1 Tax=Echinimonas agarilytica TaxID=1215918 RepID=A0AA42B716_9GAMM|nr:FeoC-like transcriptional regulator [Echinimonas agarilytica]MCM2679360.1 FeoC-like transcriptional regulator [Echinimonas agarilytica]
MLPKIETLVQQKGPMTLTMIAREMKSSEQAIEGMLRLLVMRGRLKKSSQGACDGGCCATHSGVDLYQWQGEEALPLNVFHQAS